MLHISSFKTSFSKGFSKRSRAITFFPLVVSKFTLKIPVEILAYLITKRDVKLYFAMKAVCLNYRNVFIDSLFENRFSVAEQQKHLLHVSKAYYIFQRKR